MRRFVAADDSLVTLRINHYGAFVCVDLFSFLQINPEAIDIVYASVQSGKNCDLKVTHISTNELLGTDPGTIIVAVGAKYYDFTSNVIRTLMFNSTKVSAISS